MSSPRLVERLWPAGPPPAAANTLRTYVDQLRRLLEPLRGPREGAQVLRGMPDGYRLVVEPDRIDGVRFDTTARRGLALLADGARRTGGEAVALWRGPVLADVDSAPLVADEARRLTTVLRQARVALADADLRCGRHDRAAPLGAVGRGAPGPRRPGGRPGGTAGRRSPTRCSWPTRR